MRDAHLDPAEVPSIIVANKSDVKDQPHIPATAIASFCEKHRLDYIETSARTGANVNEAFECLAYKLILTKQAPNA